MKLVLHVRVRRFSNKSSSELKLFKISFLYRLERQPHMPPGTKLRQEIYHKISFLALDPVDMQSAKYSLKLNIDQ